MQCTVDAAIDYDAQYMFFYAIRQICNATNCECKNAQRVMFNSTSPNPDLNLTKLFKNQVPKIITVV